MTDLLVVFASFEGQTRKIAKAIADEARIRGYTVDLQEASGLPDDFSVSPYRAVIVAAPIHQEHYPRSVGHFICTHRAEMATKHSAFVSVSLSIIGNGDDQEDARLCAEHFLDTVDWQPTETKHVAGALRYLEYNWLRKWTMRQIMKEARGPTDASKDYEFTDWAELRLFVRAFLLEIGHCRESADESPGPGGEGGETV